MSTEWRRVVIFIAITFAFSWSQWLGVIASQQRWSHLDLTLTPLPIFGPLVGALAVSASRERLAALGRTLGIRAPRVLVVALLLPPVVFAGSLLATSLIAPLTRALPAPSTTPVVFAGMIVTAGVGEEIGWRGFLLPELRRSLSANSASALIALIWFAWHLPLFWVRGATQADLPLAAFATGITSYSFIITALTERSRSTLAGMLFHASANTMFWLGLVTTKGTRAETVLTGLFTVTMAAIAVAAAIDMRKSHAAA